MPEAELIVLQRQVAELRRQMKLVSDWHNTMRSPWYMRLWWWLQGYRMHSLGTWYTAAWNKAGADKYNDKLG